MVHAASDVELNMLNQSMLSELTPWKIWWRFDGKNKVIKDYKAEYDRLKELDLDEKQHQLFLDYCKKYKLNPWQQLFINKNEWLKN